MERQRSPAGAGRPGLEAAACRRAQAGAGHGPAVRRHAGGRRPRAGHGPAGRAVEHARGALQTYVSKLAYGKTGHGYVLDGRGRVIAGPAGARIGAPLPLRELREAVEGGGQEGIVVTADGGEELVSSFAVAGSTGWTAVTPQGRDEFEGALVRSSRLVQTAVVALLLIAGTGLVVLHRKREAALEAVALRDELTGLYNRRGWFVLAEHELERARRQSSARVLLFVDLDGLKQVNDVLGHREGDRAIADAARVLTAASRSSDLVGRLGGD